MTKGHVLLLGLTLLALGGILPRVAQWAGVGELNAGLVSSTLLVLVVMLWVASYGWRVVRGEMTFMQMRKQYRQRYDQATDEELLRRFEALSETEQQALLSSTIADATDAAEPGTSSARQTAE